MPTMNLIRALTVVVVCVLMVLSCTSVQESPEVKGLGPIIERLETDAAYSIYGMAATASEDANRIAVDILESGGNAIDAAVAAAFAVGVADPGDSGLGGTTYILIRFADGQATVIDGSAVVPVRVDPERLAEMKEEGIERGIEYAAVPGSLAALDHAASKYGTLPLPELIEPSIDLALRGYYATPFQEVSIRTYFEDLLQSDFLKYFILEGGETPPSTTTLQCRPVLANTLRRIADGGSHEFYRGEIALEIERDMAERGGFVSRDDLGILRIREVPPLRGSYRGTEVLAIPYPSIGGSVIETLNIFENYPSTFLAQDTVDRYQVAAEAMHMAIDDHHWLLWDASSAADQARGQLLAIEHAERRANLIEIGRPVVSDELPSARDLIDEDGHTTQISVVDRWGNTVSLTQSLGRFYGNKVATPSLGFPYNSLLESASVLVPRTSIPTFMCPTIVAESGEVLLVLGSGSSMRIPGIVAIVISNVIDRGLDLRDAVLAPRVIWNTDVESGIHAEIFSPITLHQIKQLERFGYGKIPRARPPVRQSGLARFGSVNAVHLDRETRVMTGVGDPRRNGSAMGARY